MPLLVVISCSVTVTVGSAVSVLVEEDCAVDDVSPEAAALEASALEVSALVPAASS
ncbi:hypothetical protein [Salana multivorans]